ncbi:hypothetical protein E2C01_070684 [Portunus trituberculatus]|uniref:Uncharacterized protein n=1 Tax=Portunus trituberculatus TaxID=210409 RepID=A0A5B7I2S3_PORTR|nr:hypothetical protein [Portunus trituberculatus]
MYTLTRGHLTPPPRRPPQPSLLRLMRSAPRYSEPWEAVARGKGI